MPSAHCFIGRTAEIDALRADLAAALQGAGQLVLLAGEPGIGKTRTAAALAAAARQDGARVVWGHCHDDHGAPVYWPWVEALSAYADAESGEPATDIAALLPRLRSSDSAPRIEGAPEPARFELFQRVVAALGAAARAAPLVMILDDLHWADAGSLRLLEVLARQLDTLPLFVLGTLRDEALRHNADLNRQLAATLRLGRRVPLRGLAPAGVAELLGDRLGRTPDAAVVDEVVALTDGNPFFVIEVAHLLAAGAPVTDRHGAAPVPPGVQELFRRRLEPLSEAERAVLDAAAVIGRDFDLPLLAAVLRQPPAALLERLDAPLAHSLLREAPDRPQRYAFTHALLRETLYAQLAAGPRAALHLAVAEALEAIGPPDDVRLPALAHHFFAAAPLADPAAAVRYACAAGERALRLLGFEAAVRHFERAVAGLAQGGDDARRLRALIGLGEALVGAGDPARAAATLRQAVALARRGAAPAFAETVLALADAGTEFGTLDVEMNALLDEALAALPAAASGVRARLGARLAAGLQLAPGADAERRRLADEAAAMARGLGEPATLAYVLGRRLGGLLGPDDLEERLATTDALLRAGSHSRAAEIEALVVRVDDLAERGDRVGLDHALAVLEQRARAFPHPLFLWTVANFRTAMALLEGRFDEAEQLANQGLALGQQAQTRTAPLQYAQQVFMLRGWQDRLDEVEPIVAAGVAETAVVPAWRCGLAEFYSIAGRTAEARREFEALAADDFATLPRDTTWLTSMVLIGDVCVRLGDTRRAGQLYEQMLPYRGRIAVARPLVVLVGAIDLRLAMLAGLRGDLGAAEAHFADALPLAERMRALPWQAEIRHEWAAALARCGGPAERQRARRLLDAAEAIAAPLGMRLLQRWIAATSVRLRDGTPEEAVAERSAIFRRAGDVWTLVFGQRTTHVRDMLGMGHLARLLSQPAREIHVVDLAGSGARRPPGADDAGEVLDARARADYAARLRDARAELGEAQQLNDQGRAERLSEEVEFLTAELGRSYGLAGRPRRAGSTNERARIAVTRAIKYAIDKIAAHDPLLAEHLRGAVRTGTFCVYTPPSRDRVTWTL